MFHKKTEIEKADLLGERFVGAVPEIAAFLLSEISKMQPDIAFKDEKGPGQFAIELYVFYFHMLDRLAFLHLGEEGREIFANRLIEVVTHSLILTKNNEWSDLDFAAEMQSTYNQRQLEYANYKELIPPKDKPLKGTLIWEFSKNLFELLVSSNPAILGLLSLIVSDCTITFLTKALRAGSPTYRAFH